MGKLEILAQAGFTEDPFHGCEMETADAVRVRNILGMAVKAHSQVAIVGDRGVGKSRAVAAALRRHKCKVVHVLSADKGKITAGDLIEAMILDLSDEAPRKTKEIRVRQLRRILGEASRKQPIVVVIEEAHRLHGHTLRSLKNLRELDWMGQTQLFAVVLIGQSDCTQRSGLSEVRLRTETVHMHGLTQSEILSYITATVGAVCAPEASTAIAALDDARNYLDLQELLIRGLANALAAGRDRIVPADLTDRSNRPLPSSTRTAGKTNDAVQAVLARKRASQSPLRAVELPA